MVPEHFPVLNAVAEKYLVLELLGALGFAHERRREPGTHCLHHVQTLTIVCVWYIHVVMRASRVP